jgi:hypothetical protein
MTGDERLKSISLENQFDSSKYNCYANSAYRNAMKKTGLNTTNQSGLISNYIYAMVTYEDLKSDENYKHLEKSERKYKDFLSLNR